MAPTVSARALYGTLIGDGNAFLETCFAGFGADPAKGIGGRLLAWAEDMARANGRVHEFFCWDKCLDSRSGAPSR